MPLLIKYFLVFIAGCLAGFINVNAGGGSLLTIPALIFMGLPPLVANATNRIAVLCGAISATMNFKRKGIFDIKLGLLLGFPALIGAIIGTAVAVNISEKLFSLILSGVMLIVLASVFIKPKQFKSGLMVHFSLTRKIMLMILFIFVGFYGGFIQAGVGVLIVGLMSFVTPLSLKKINSMKMFVVGIYTAFSIMVFMAHGKIDFFIGFVLAFGNVVGAYAGSNFVVSKDDRWIKLILFISIILMALKLMSNL